MILVLIDCNYLARLRALLESWRMPSYEARLSEKSMKKRSGHEVHEHVEEIFRSRLPINWYPLKCAE
jgi:hypothetical protein